MDLQIDQEFKNWIMPLQEDEYDRLEKSIVVSGCRDPLVVWNGILIDGHNRYKICKKHGIGFQVHEMQFKSRDEAKEWMIQNQLARRNITKWHRTYFIGKLYASQKSKHGGIRKKGPRNENARTSEHLAKQFKVSKSTVERAERFALDIDTVAANCGLGVRDDILSGTIELTNKRIRFLASMKDSEQMAIIKMMRNGLHFSHAFGRLCSDKFAEDREIIAERKIEERKKFQLPCANPSCYQWIRVTIKQYKTYMSSPPAKRRCTLFPYCSKYCRDEQMLEDAEKS